MFSFQWHELAPFCALGCWKCGKGIKCLFFFMGKAWENKTLQNPGKSQTKS